MPKNRNKPQSNQNSYIPFDEDNQEQKFLTDSKFFPFFKFEEIKSCVKT